MIKHNLLIIDDDIDYLKTYWLKVCLDTFDVKCAHNL